MAHIKLNTIQAGESLTHDAYNRSLESWTPTKQGKVSLENIRDQGLDLCNFDADSVRAFKEYGLDLFEVQPNLGSSSAMGFILGSLRFVRKQGFDYVLRVSAAFDFQANYSGLAAHPNGDTCEKVFDIRVLYEVKDNFGNIIKPRQALAPTSRRIGVKGRQAGKVFCRENYTITSYLNASALDYNPSQPDEGTVTFELQYRLITNEDPLMDEKVIRFKHVTGSVTTYRR